MLSEKKNFCMFASLSLFEAIRSVSAWGHYSQDKLRHLAEIKPSLK